MCPLHNRTLPPAWAALAFGLAVLATPAPACTTPVFQYALDRWPAEACLLTVYHKGPRSEEAQAALDLLTRPLSIAHAPANLEVMTLDLDRALSALTPPAATTELEWMELKYPSRKGGVESVWSGPLTRAAVDVLLDSPARREIARRLLAGQPGVWVFLECGDQGKDDAAAKLLAAELARCGAAQGADDAQGAPKGTGAAPGPPTASSIVRVSRDDAAEAALVGMLLHSEPGLAARKGEPMAFPIFGRGRVLYAVVGRGINRRVIAEACGFLTAACACEIKEDNPGTDLLIASKWEGASDATAAGAQALPPLTGVFPGAPGGGKADAGRVRSAHSSVSAAKGGGLRRNVAAVLVGAVVIVLAGSMVLWRRRARADR